MVMGPGGCGVTALGPQAPALRVPGGDTVYDYAWYPRMDSNLPHTCL